MVKSAYARLRRAAGTRAFHEVPLLGRSIDIVYMRGSSLTSVEFKLSNWRRALVQARDHQLAVDFSYVCMPQRSFTEPMRVAFREVGVGLMFFSMDERWPFHKVLAAKRSRAKWAEARAWLFEYVHGLAVESQ